MKESMLIQTEPLSELVAEKIIEIIKDRGLIAGDQIPTELELIEMLGVGRSTVREAKKLWYPGGSWRSEGAGGPSSATIRRFPKILSGSPSRRTRSRPTGIFSP